MRVFVIWLGNKGKRMQETPQLNIKDSYGTSTGLSGNDFGLGLDLSLLFLPPAIA